MHMLSPEFDPAVRLVSEYANGQYAWVLSAMLLVWALSSWRLSLALWPRLKSNPQRGGVMLLSTSGLGEAMGAL
jgi:hypothetical protein